METSLMNTTVLIDCLPAANVWGKERTKYSRAPVFTDSVSAVYRGPKKFEN
jgi:hypothetical protein